MWSRHCARAAEMAAHPRDSTAVIEAQHDLGAHRDTAAVAAHQADQVHLGLALTRQRHEIDNRNRAFGGFERRLKDAGVAAVAAAGARVRVLRRDEPAAVLWFAEQCGKYRLCIESRQAQPIDRADDAVIFDRHGHSLSLGDPAHPTTPAPIFRPAPACGAERTKRRQGARPASFSLRIFLRRNPTVTGTSRNLPKLGPGQCPGML